MFLLRTTGLKKISLLVGMTMIGVSFFSCIGGSSTPFDPVPPPPAAVDPLPPALSSCNVASVGAGEQFTCEAPGFKEGCTCFVCGTPASCHLLEEGRGTSRLEIPEELSSLDVMEMKGPKVQMTAPALTCRGGITFQCGIEDPTTVAQEFSVVVSVPGKKKVLCSGSDCDKKSSYAECKKDPDCGEGEQCESGFCVSPQIDPPPPVLSGCGDDIDCGGGMLCQSTNCVTPPPSPVLKASMTSRLDPGHLGVVQIGWNIQKGTDEIAEAYLYGFFNRDFGDTDCGLAGNRYLVTNPDGTDIRKDSPNYSADKYGLYLGIEPNKGVECTDDTACYQVREITKKRNWNSLICKIDLLPLLKKGKTGQVIFTKMRSPYSGYVLYARGKDGKVAFSGLDDSIQAPRPVFSSTVTVRQDKPLIHISAQYSHTYLAGVSGCKLVSSAPGVASQNGTGTYEGDCEIDGDVTSGKKFTVGYYGIGDFILPSSVEKYTVTFGTPQPHLQKGSMTCDPDDPMNAQSEADCHGDLNINWGVDRTCKITKNSGAETDCLTPVVHWADSIELWAKSFSKGWTQLDKHSMIAASDTSGTLKAKRDHDVVTWGIRINDYNGSRTGDDGKYDLSYEYRPSIAVSDASPDLTLTFAQEKNNDCKEVSGGALHAKFNVKTRHAKKVKIRCGDTTGYGAVTIGPLLPGAIVVEAKSNDPKGFSSETIEIPESQYYNELINTFQVDIWVGTHTGGSAWPAVWPNTPETVTCQTTTVDYTDKSLGDLFVQWRYECR